MITRFFTNAKNFIRNPNQYAISRISKRVEHDQAHIAQMNQKLHQLEQTLQKLDDEEQRLKAEVMQQRLTSLLVTREKYQRQLDDQMYRLEKAETVLMNEDAGDLEKAAQLKMIGLIGENGQYDPDGPVKMLKTLSDEAAGAFSGVLDEAKGLGDEDVKFLAYQKRKLLEDVRLQAEEAEVMYKQKIRV